MVGIAEGPGSIAGWGTKIPQKNGVVQKIKKRKKDLFSFQLLKNIGPVSHSPLYL